MNILQVTSNKLADKIGDISPDLIAALITALLQVVSQCIQKDNPTHGVVSGDDIVDWLEAKDVGWLARPIVSNIRRNRMDREIEYQVTANSRIPNKLVPAIRRELMAEVNRSSRGDVKALHMCVNCNAFSEKTNKPLTSYE